MVAGHDRVLGATAVAVNIAIVGLSLYGTGFSGVGNCVQVTLQLHFHPLSAIPYAHYPPRVDSIGVGSYHTFPAARKPATANYVTAWLSTRYHCFVNVQLR